MGCPTFRERGYGSDAWRSRRPALRAGRTGGGGEARAVIAALPTTARRPEGACAAPVEQPDEADRAHARHDDREDGHGPGHGRTRRQAGREGGPEVGIQEDRDARGDARQNKRLDERVLLGLGA